MSQLSSQIPIFCINLQRATERRQLIQELWIDGLGIDINFWEAYDRRNIENGIYQYSYNPKKNNRDLK